MTVSAMVNRIDLRAEFLQSGQSEILRFAQNDSEGLSMTAASQFQSFARLKAASTFAGRVFIQSLKRAGGGKP